MIPTISESQIIDFEKLRIEHPESPRVIPAWAYADQVNDYFYGERANAGLLLPWSKTHGDIKIRPGEVSIWAAANGAGKSLMLNQAVVLPSIVKGDPCCIASFEMTPVQTMARMTRQTAHSRFPDPGFINAFHEWTDGKLWFYDQQNIVKADRVLSVVRYCTDALYHKGKKTPVKQMIIDSLMKCGVGAEDWDGQRNFVNTLTALARDTGIHIHLVCHLRKGVSERQIPDKYDVAGHADITNQVDNVFLLWRNKDKEDEAHLPASRQDSSIMEKPDALLITAKQRHGDWEGRTSLWFHRESTQYIPEEGKGAIPFFNYSREAYA